MSGNPPSRAWKNLALSSTARCCPGAREKCGFRFQRFAEGRSPNRGTFPNFHSAFTRAAYKESSNPWRAFFGISYSRRTRDAYYAERFPDSASCWHNQSLAQEMADAVADDIGTPNEFNGEEGRGPLFAWNLDAIDTFIWFQGTVYSMSIPTSGIDILSFSWGVGSVVNAARGVRAATNRGQCNI